MDTSRISSRWTLTNSSWLGMGPGVQESHTPTTGITADEYRAQQAIHGRDTGDGGDPSIAASPDASNAVATVLARRKAAGEPLESSLTTQRDVPIRQALAAQEAAQEKEARDNAAAEATSLTNIAQAVDEDEAADMAEMEDPNVKTYNEAIPTHSEPRRLEIRQAGRGMARCRVRSTAVGRGWTERFYIPINKERLMEKANEAAAAEWKEAWNEIADDPKHAGVRKSQFAKAMLDERNRLENSNDLPSSGLPAGEIGDAYKAMVVDSELGAKFEELKKEHGGTPEQFELDWTDVTADTLADKAKALGGGKLGPVPDANTNWLTPVERAVNIPGDYVADKALWVAKAGLGAISATAQLTEYTHDQDRDLMHALLAGEGENYEPESRWEHWKGNFDPSKQSEGTLGQELIPVASQIDAYQDLRS